jgi:Na+-driven multidrug efflux pump
MTLLAGKLTHEELAAHVAIMNIYILIIVFAIGVQNVLLNFVGVAMGENNP